MILWFNWLFWLAHELLVPGEPSFCLFYVFPTSRYSKCSHYHVMKGGLWKVWKLQRKFVLVALVSSYLSAGLRNAVIVREDRDACEHPYLFLCMPLTVWMAHPTVVPRAPSHCEATSRLCILHNYTQFSNWIIAWFNSLAASGEHQHCAAVAAPRANCC